MANILDKDPFTYQKERESFLKDLHRFHVSRGTGYKTFPSLSGREIDLYLLYNKVTRYGGWVKITDEQRWDEIQELFHIPHGCTNAAVALKQIYIRYLSHYEKAHHFGEDPDRIRDDQIDENSRQAWKKAAGLMGGVQLHYNWAQHQLSDHQRRTLNLKLPSELSSSGDYRNLELALLCGLPNEVDFALNVCTLLSNEGRHTIQLNKCPHLLRYLLAHVGIYEQDYESMYRLHEIAWRTGTKTNYSQFWYESVADKEIRKFLVPGSFTCTKRKCLSQAPASPDTLSDDGQDTQATSSMSDCHGQDTQATSSMSDCQIVHENLEKQLFREELSDLFSLDRDLGLTDKEGQRVLQLAMIIRNLSFEKDNMDFISNDLATFRFLLLCIHNKYSSLRQLALDTLSNIALKMVLQPIRHTTTQLVFQIIANCIASNDKFFVISGLDMLARFCQVEANEELLCDNLQDTVYEDIIRLLTIQDIQMIVYTLEVLYQLSELGEVTTSHIAAVKMAVETLVNLVTVEAQSYGPDSLIGIKVVEHVTTVPTTNAEPEPVTKGTIQQQMSAPLPATPIQTAKLVNRPVPTLPGPLISTPQRPKPLIPTPVKQLAAATSTPQRPAMVPTPPPSTPSAAALTIAAQQSMKPQLEMDGESLARFWLQAHYDFLLGSKDEIPKMELYGEFLSTCGRLFIKNIATAAGFSNCVRMIFPKVEIVKTARLDGSFDHIYKGLIAKAVPLTFPPNDGIAPVVATQHAPVQISALQVSSAGGQASVFPRPGPPPLSMVTPGTASPQTPSGPMSPAKYPQQVQTYPTIQQALMTGRATEAVPRPPTPQSPQAPANSTLIKSLLANKVTQNINRQVPAGMMNNMVQQQCIGPEQPLQSYAQPVMNQQAPIPEPGAQPFTTLQQSVPPDQARSKPAEKEQPGEPVTPKRKRNRSPRSKASAPTVFTDIQAMTDVIESVARQGFVDSDDDDDEKPDTPLMAHEGVSEDPITFSPAPPENMDFNEPVDNGQGAGDKSSCDIAKEEESTVNGSSLQNGIFYEKNNHASGDASSNHVVSERPKASQPIMNGSVYHVGNGNCANALMSKNLQALNNKICENSTVNSALKNAPQNDEASEKKCEISNAVTEAPARKSVMENGFCSVEENYKVSQLDGTQDDDDVMETENAVQQLAAIQESMTTETPENDSGPSAVQLTPQLFDDNSQETNDSQTDLVDPQQLGDSNSAAVNPTSEVAPGLVTSMHGLQSHVIQASAFQPHMVQVPGQSSFMTSSAHGQVIQPQLSVATAQSSAPIVHQAVSQSNANPMQLQQQQQNLQLQQQQLQLQLQQLQQIQQKIQQQWIQTQQAQQQLGIPTTQTSTAYILPKPGTEQTTVPVTSQISPNQPQTLILPKPSSQPVQLLLRPPPGSAGSIAFSGVPAGQTQSTVVRFPISMQQGQTSQGLPIKSQFVLPPGGIGSVAPTSLTGGQALPIAASQQVLQQQLRPQLVQTGAGVIRTQLIPPQIVTAQGQTQYIQQRQILQQGPIGSPALTMNQPQTTRPQIQPVTTQAPRMITTQAQFLQMPSLTATSGSLMTMVVSSQSQLQPSQQGMMSQNRLAAPSGQCAPTIQIPASQLTMPSLSMSHSPAPLTVNVAPSPISTPPPPSPQSSRTSQVSPTNSTSGKLKRPAASASETRSSKKKKSCSSSKSRTSSTDSRPPSRSGGQPSPAPPASIPQPCANKYCCEWAGCKQWFDTLKVFNKHIIKEHFERQHQQAVCMWQGCDNLRRPKWSLMTHLQDRHMNDTSLKSPAKKQDTAPTTAPPSTPTRSGAPPVASPSAPPKQPIYPENAALQAIRRFAPRPPYPEFVEMKEGPVTKHIRLTSALILRNLARFSALGRSQLKKHEQHLSYIAMSSQEASGPISTCLWELHQTDPH